MAEGMGNVAAAGAAATTAGVATGAPSTDTSIASAGTEISTKAPVAAAPKTYEVKVDGQIVKMTEAEITQFASLGKAAHKRINEANTSKAQVDAFWKEFNENPMKAMDKTQLSRDQKRKFIEEYYKEEFIAKDAMTPEQKKIAELETYKKQREEKDANEKQQAAEQFKLAEQNKWAGIYEDKILNHLKARNDLPRDPSTLRRMAFYLHEHNKQNPHLNMDQVERAVQECADRVRDDFHNDFKTYSTPDTSPEALIKLLGPDAVKKIQRYALEQHKAKLNAGFGAAEAPTEITPRKKPEPKHPAEGWKQVTNYWARRDK